LNNSLQEFIEFIGENQNIHQKERLIQKAESRFALTKDRKIYYSEKFAVRFSASSSSTSFSNTVISLSALKNYDESPFIVCLVTPNENKLFLANTTFIKKVSHSSQELRENNIKGSINGSDIIKNFNGKENIPKNFDYLFAIHKEIGFQGNLTRLVEATNNIVPTGHAYVVDDKSRKIIIDSVDRAISFSNSKEFKKLKLELDEKVEKFKNEIIIASFIENTNVRGRLIEYLIAGDDEELRQSLIEALHAKKLIPSFRTKNTLGDFSRTYGNIKTETDIKTKIIILSSNPKGYNIDKILEYMSDPNTVFLFYFIGVEPNNIANTVLVSIFENTLLNSTIILKHWAGRNSRGVTQFEGKIINDLLKDHKSLIDPVKSKVFVENLISLI
jgi:hypothetical protein